MGLQAGLGGAAGWEGRGCHLGGGGGVVWVGRGCRLEGVGLQAGVVDGHSVYIHVCVLYSVEERRGEREMGQE